MFRMTAIMLCSILVSGCLSPEQRAYNQQLQAQQEEQQRAAYREGLLVGCDSFGFKRGTDAHANCVLSRHQQNMQLLGTAVLMQQQQQQQDAARQRAFKPYTPPPTYRSNCYTDYLGNTNCTTTRQ